MNCRYRNAGFSTFAIRTQAPCITRNNVSICGARGVCSTESNLGYSTMPMWGENRGETQDYSNTSESISHSATWKRPPNCTGSPAKRGVFGGA